MFQLGMAWWEFPLRGAIVYFTLLLLVRLSGKRTVGQFTPFDLLVVMFLSESVSNSLSGGDESVLGGLLIALTLILLNMAVGVLASRSKAMEKVIDGEPVLVGRDGRFFPEVTKRHRLSQGDLENALREHDCDLSEMRVAMLETDGQISILKK
jgi:uncharacterized membrane protein YcaP (DUF421 family)